MNKGELIESVAASAGLSRSDATKAVDAVLDSVTKTLANGGSVSLVGFGTFSVKSRAARRTAILSIARKTVTGGMPCSLSSTWRGVPGHQRMLTVTVTWKIATATTCTASRQGSTFTPRL